MVLRNTQVVDADGELLHQRRDAGARDQFLKPESSKKLLLRVWALGSDSRVSSRRIRELPPLIPRPKVWPVRLAAFPTPKNPRRAFQRPPSDRVVVPSLGEVRLSLEHGGVLDVHDLRAASRLGHVNLVVVREVVVDDDPGE